LAEVKRKTAFIAIQRWGLLANQKNDTYESDNSLSSFGKSRDSVIALAHQGFNNSNRARISRRKNHRIVIFIKFG
jgi:hypothetical protein